MMPHFQRDQAGDQIARVLPMRRCFAKLKIRLSFNEVRRNQNGEDDIFLSILRMVIRHKANEVAMITSSGLLSGTKSN